jgi:ATP-binding cassette subfamily C (CFTR/MRP) protein 1
MKQGALVEYGEPHKLIEQQGSYFKSLYEDVSRTGNGGEGEMGDDEIGSMLAQ